MSSTMNTSLSQIEISTGFVILRSPWVIPSYDFTLIKSISQSPISLTKSAKNIKAPFNTQTNTGGCSCLCSLICSATCLTMVFISVSVYSVVGILYLIESIPKIF